MTADIDLGIQHLEDLAVVGRGGFSVVYSATHSLFKRRMAVKVLNRLSSESEHRRFERECEVMGRLSDHPNVVSVHNAGYTPSGHPYLLMQLVEGGSLDDRLKQQARIPWREALGYVIPICSALERAHREGVLHRDVKPENILLDGDTPLLADFGIASLRDATGATSTHITASLAHTAPETFENRRDERSDLYSLASTLHTLIMGSSPFWRAGDSSVHPMMNRLLNEPPPPIPLDRAPAGLSQLLQRTLSKDPGQRPQTAAELRSELERLLDVGPTNHAGSNGWPAASEPGSNGWPAASEPGSNGWPAASEPGSNGWPAASEPGFDRVAEPGPEWRPRPPASWPGPEGPAPSSGPFPGSAPPYGSGLSEPPAWVAPGGLQSGRVDGPPAVFPSEPVWSQAVAAPARDASPAARIAARTIDHVIWFLMWLAVIMPFYGGEELTEGEDYVALLVSTLVTTTLVVAYEVVMVAMAGGTVGKLLLGIRVRREDGGPMTYRTAVARQGLDIGIGIGTALIVLPIALGWLLALVGLVNLFTDHRRRTPWDRLAGTVVETR